MVSFVPLNIHDEDSVSLVLAQIDNAIQYGEDVEPKEPQVCRAHCFSDSPHSDATFRYFFCLLKPNFLGYGGESMKKKALHACELNIFFVI
jgi:hypothetical protein